MDVDTKMPAFVNNEITYLTEHYTGRCKHCHAGKRITLMFPKNKLMSLWTPEDHYACTTRQQGGAVVACKCGHRVAVKRVIGRFRADKKCDGRCEAATGQQCECSCGGKNHGCVHG